VASFVIAENCEVILATVVVVKAMFLSHKCTYFQCAVWRNFC